MASSNSNQSTMLTAIEREAICEAIWLWEQTPEQTVEDHVLPVIEDIIADRLEKAPSTDDRLKKAPLLGKNTPDGT